MTPTAVVTGADRGLGYALTQALLERGWLVFAGQYMPGWPDLGSLATERGDMLQIIPLDVAHTPSVRDAADRVAAHGSAVDLLVSNAGIGGDRSTLDAGLDYAAMQRAYQVNALGALRVVEAFLPLTDRSSLKRLCFVTSEAGSIALAHRDGSFGYCMSKAALNMVVKLLFNALRPEGYTFRLYHPGWMRSYMSGVKGTAGDMEPKDAAVPALSFLLEDRADEDRLVMVDYMGGEWPF